MYSKAFSLNQMTSKKQQQLKLLLQQSNKAYPNRNRLLLTNLKEPKSSYEQLNTQCSSFYSPYSMTNITRLQKNSHPAEPLLVSNDSQSQVEVIFRRNNSKASRNNFYLKTTKNSTQMTFPLCNSKSTDKTNSFMYNSHMRNVKQNKEQSVKPKPKQFNSNNTSLRSASYHLNKQHQPHKSFNIIRNFLSHRTNVNSALKMMIKYKAIKHLMQNYSQFVFIILNNYAKPINEVDNQMTKQCLLQHFRLYKEKAYRSFIDDLFLLFDDKGEGWVDLRCVFSVFTLASNVINSKEAIENVIDCWEKEGMIALHTIMTAFLYVLPQKNKRKKLVDVIKEAFENIDLTQPLIDSRTAMLYLQSSFELEGLILQLRSDINGVDAPLKEELRRISKRIMINAQYEVNKKDVQKHYYNEVKNIGRTLRSLNVLNELHKKHSEEDKSA